MLRRTGTPTLYGSYDDCGRGPIHAEIINPASMVTT